MQRRSDDRLAEVRLLRGVVTAGAVTCRFPDQAGGFYDSHS